MTTLLIPSVKKKNGTGHLKRSLHLAERLVREGQECQFFLDASEEEKNLLLERFPSLIRYPLFSSRSEVSPVPDRIFMDNRETSLSEWLAWERIAPVISLDEGGEARNYSSFLIDTFPSLSKHAPNRRGSPLFRKKEPKTKAAARGKGSILITFGGEDPAGLSEPVAGRLLNAYMDGRKIAVVQGPLAGDIDLPEEVELYKAPENLDELYQSFETVVTSFGLTPYEALEAGCRVVLVNPTAYHEKLSRKAGFTSAGVGAKAANSLVTLIDRGLEKTGSGEDALRFSDVITTLGTAPSAECPLCGREANPVHTRFGDRSFYYCPDCGNYYLVNWNREEEQYDREYFFSRYKNQYGKTYLEDFDNIKGMGYGRLKEIDRSLAFNEKGSSPLLTDLGCAFGPFLNAAAEKGYQCRGVEINEDGADWIEENLKIPVMRGSLEDEGVLEQLRKRPGDVTTLWYVIEHIPNQRELLENLKLTLRKGGVLAFGTPSGAGVSAKRDLRHFLERSPADHYVIYTPRGARRLLKRSGFESVRVKSVGHHPERFGRWVGKKGSFTYNVILLMSRWFSWGDSLEVYAVKSTD